MKKGNNELVRLQTLIEHDRLNGGDDFLDLLKCDLNKLLIDYFDILGELSVSLDKNGDGLCLNIKALIARVKNFSSLPK